MLSGVALEYYFSNVKGTVTDIEGMISKIRERFLTEERILSMTQEWDSISLPGYIKDNPTQSKKDLS